MCDIIKILKDDIKPYDTLMDLFNEGKLHNILPELTNLYSDENGYKNNFIHTLKVLKNVCDITDKFEIKLVALLHDIGKPITKRRKGDNDWTFYNHEFVGAKMSMKVLDRLNIIDKGTKNYVYVMIENHGRLKIHRDVTDSAIRRLDKDIGKDIIFDLIDFCKCDITTKFDNKKNRIISNLDTIKNRIIEVRKLDEESKWRSPITGHVIMDLLNIKPGRIIGDIKSITDPKIKSGEWTEEDAIQFIIKNYKPNH